MMYIWCTQCVRLCTTEAKADHDGHLLVGIRPDILTDVLKRAVADLRRTGRLEAVR